MPLKIITGGGGSVILDANTTSSNYTMYIPAENGALLTSGSAINASIINAGTLSGDRLPTIPVAKLPSGVILQVVQTVVSSQSSYSSNSDWTDMLGYTLAITPRTSTSKILLRAVLNCSISGTTTINFRWVRNSTVIAVGDTGTDGQASFRTNTPNAAWTNPAVGEFLDSPATTSSITYKLQFRPYDGGRTVVFNNAVSGGAGDNYRTISTITAMEVAA